MDNFSDVEKQIMEVEQKIEAGFLDPNVTSVQMFDLVKVHEELIDKLYPQPIVLPNNVLIFSQFKRKKPLVHRLYTNPCEVIDLNTYRNHKTIKKVG